MRVVSAPVPVWASWMGDASARFFVLLAGLARRRGVQVTVCGLLLVLVVLSQRWRLDLMAAPMLLVFAVLGVAPLLTLRRWPWASIAVILTSNAVFVLFARLAWPMPNVWAWLIAVLAAPLLLERRWAVLGLVFTELVVVAAVFMPASVNATPWDATVAGFLAVLLCWTVGSRLRQREESGRERAQMVARVQELEVSDAVSRGRVDMARELHDVVAHHVSLIAVQAATARYSIADLPVAGGQAFDDIAEQARTALTELRGVLGVLRAPDTAAPQRPTPTLEDIADLVARTGAADAPITFTVTGRGQPSSAPVGLTGYRIVQEALTNAARHAPGGAIQVRVDHHADRVVIAVRNGPGKSVVVAARTGRGYGLLGMRERVATLGGQLHTGPDPAGGFLVSAVLPTRPPPWRCRSITASSADRSGMTEQPRPPLRVLIADDQAVVRLGFAALLASQPDLQVVGAVGDGRAAVQQARVQRADLVLMDVRMPILGGIEATAQLQQQNPAPKVIVLTTFDLDEYIYDALRAGASGFLLKDATPARIVEAIRVVAAGDALLDPAVTRRVITQFADRPRLIAAARCGDADRPGTGHLHAAGQRTLQRRDRRHPAPGRTDRQNSRQRRAGQAGYPGPGPGRRIGLRNWHRYTRGLTVHLPRRYRTSGTCDRYIHSPPAPTVVVMTDIAVTRLSKRYGSTDAVNDVSFVVNPGRVTGFLGPNGAGKSTTMRLILGLARADDRFGHHRRRPLPIHPPSVAHRRRRVGGAGRARRPQRVRPSAVPGAEQRDTPQSGRRGPGPGRAHRRRRSARPHLLARHGSAARNRGRPVGRPAGADVRRTDQRAGP